MLQDQEGEPVPDHGPGADDQTLIAAALRGDEEALGRLLTRDQEWAYNVAYRVLGQEADARDAVQDAFLLTLRALRGDGSPPHTLDSFRPWLRRVVVNSALTQVRRRPAVRAVPFDEVAESLPGPEHGEPGGSTERAETREKVLQVLLALPETQRVALALKEYLDASYGEIAETLGIPRTAVGTLLFRARAAFRAAYDRVTETAAPIDCPDLVPLFAAIVDNEPRPAAWNQLEQHLRDCERCQNELESQRRARRLYALIPLAALPAGWDPVKAALGAAAAGAGHAATTLGGTSTAAGAANASAVTGTSGAATDAGVGGTVGAAGGAGVGGVPPLPPGGDPVGPALAGHAVAASAASVAAPVAEAPAVATGGGLLAGAASAKLTLAALATAGVIGAAVVAAPLMGSGPDPAASPAPSPGIVLSPAASPMIASSQVAASPVAASPASSTIGAIVFPTASPSPTPRLGTLVPAVAPSPAPPAPPARASPVPSPVSRVSGSTGP